ncbi:hypothetical protein ABIE65_003945, partial [Constrictibacter sp. MBR-5]
QDTHDEPLRRSLDAAPPAHPFHSINFFNSKADFHRRSAS